MLTQHGCEQWREGKKKQTTSIWVDRCPMLISVCPMLCGSMWKVHRLADVISLTCYKLLASCLLKASEPAARWPPITQHPASPITQLPTSPFKFLLMPGCPGEIISGHAMGPGHAAPVTPSPPSPRVTGGLGSSANIRSEEAPLRHGESKTSKDCKTKPTSTEQPKRLWRDSALMTRLR